ncbi:glycosyltransferase family 2 protein [Enterobacter cloacae]|uniref:glycosyltransferase family 2 protein n=1 Tax=Enterobacter cloacae TaxID=550 RepID=UPI0032AEDDE8
MLNVSFIIPVYNVSAYLKDFFSPFKLCTLPCEIIFIDDGSTDTSAEILKQFALADPRVIVLHKENGGVSTARNYGISHASGKFISCLDPDDLLSPTFFKYLEESIKKFNDVDTIIYRYEKFQDGIEPEILNAGFDFSSLELIPKKVLSTIHNYPWVRVVRREFFNNNLFPEGIIYEDSVTVPLLNARAQNVLKINEVLYYYRVRKDSLTNYNVLRNMELVTALSLLEERVKEIKEYRPHLYSCVAHLSRSALITLYKTSKTNSSSHILRENQKIIYTKFNQYPLSLILQCDANLPDKICFALLKMNKIGFFCFKILYNRISK